MKALLLHPFESRNLGDKVILEGTQNLLFTAFGEYQSHLCDLDRAINDESYLRSFNWKGVDLLVLSGTPWLWDKCHQSLKYQVLEKILLLLPEGTKKIALGIGSCFPLATNVMEVYLYQKDDAGRYEITRLHTREKLYDIFSKFDLVATRDILAYRILQSVGVSAYHSICPAAFISTVKPKLSTGTFPYRPLLVFMNPFDGVSRESCDRNFIEDYIQFQKWFKVQFDPVVATMDPLDRDWCEGQNWKVTWLQTMEDLRSAIASSSFVVSGRVHASIPAVVLGKASYILPQDTRYLTTVRLGVTPILTWSDMDWSSCADILAKSMGNLAVRGIIKSHFDFLVDKLRQVKEVGA